MSTLTFDKKGGLIAGSGTVIGVRLLDDTSALVRVNPKTTVSAVAEAVRVKYALPSTVDWGLAELSNKRQLNLLSPDVTIKAVVGKWTEAETSAGNSELVLVRLVFSRTGKAQQLERGAGVYQSAAMGEAVFHILNGDYRFGRPTLVELASLSLASRHGCSAPTVDAGLVEKELQSHLVPSYAVRSEGGAKKASPLDVATSKDAVTAKDLVAEILAKYEGLASSLSRSDAMGQYLKEVSAAHGYGSVFFSGRRTWKDQEESTPGPKMNERTEDVLICVGFDGILLLSMDDPLLLESHQFETITRWTVSRDGKIFAFSVDDSIIIYLITPQAAAIERSVERSVASLVSERSLSEPPPNPVVGDIPPVMTVVASTVYSTVEGLPLRASAPAPAPAPASTPSSTPSATTPTAQAGSGGASDDDAGTTAKSEGDGGDGGDGDGDGDGDANSGDGDDDGGPLPEGWSRSYDDDGDVYYVNDLTGESSWDRPTEPATGGALPDDTADDDAKDEDYDPDLPAGWEKHKDDEGDVFYVNKTSGEAVWEKPREPAAGYVIGGDLEADAAAAGEEDEGPLPEGWEAHQDDDGDTFYVNTATGESVWERPTADA